MGFRERLTEARKAKGLNQEALGKALGMSKQGVSHWETGRYEPSLEQLAALCDVLNVSADWLVLGRSPEQLGPEAIEQGKFYTRLSPELKKKWKTVSLMFMDATPDHEVERKMPITKRAKEPN